MVHFIALLLALAGFSPLANAQYGYGGGGDPGGYGSGSAPTTAPQPQSTASTANSTIAKLGVGDVQCTPAMCIGASLNGNNIEYVMQSTGAQQVGWMAMGFGSSMVGSPMVVMWMNPDNSFSLSQREARQNSLPAVDPNPDRRAVINSDLSVWRGAQPKFAYTIPVGTDMKPKLIWAFGEDQPTAAVPDQATFKQHVAFGRMSLDLTKQSTRVDILESPALLNGGSAGGSGGSPQPSTPRTSKEKIALAHGVVCAVAYLVVMPAGALLARYYRTLSSTWFKGHWIVQFGVASPLVFTGAILAIALSRSGGPSSWDTHAQVGVLLFVLYGTQCLFGAVIHFVKPSGPRKRPPQNYAHAVLGITIIVLGFYQVRTGYKVQWPKITGETTAQAIDVLWSVWAVCIPLAYFGGLVFLKKQYAQERQARHRAAQERAKLGPWGERKFQHV